MPTIPRAEGEHVAGAYRQRVTLASGRFAMIDDGLGFQFVPWRPALEQKLGQHVAGTITPGGAVDWSFGRKRGIRTLICSNQRRISDRAPSLASNPRVPDAPASAAYSDGMLY